MQRPLISCLIVSGPRRMPYVPDAVKGFFAQTWTPRELVIVWDGVPGDDRALAETLGVSGRPDVRIVLADPARGLSLGARRNLSVASARGDLVCQWDDDDLSHPERLDRQARHLLASGCSASFLGDVVAEDLATGRAFCLDFGPTQDPASRMHHGTLMMRRGQPARYPEEGPTSHRGEDTVLLHQLMRAGSITVLRGDAALYVYRWHGANTVTSLHFARMVGGLTIEPPPAARPRFDGLVSLYGRPSFDALQRPADGQALYDEVLAAVPDSPDGRQHRAWRALTGGRTDEAWTLLHAILADGIADTRSLVALAGLYQADGKLAQAGPLVRPALEALGYDDPNAVACLGSIHLAEGRLPEALRYFDRACALAPWDPIPANDRGVVLARLGRLREAVAAFLSVLELDPARASAHDNLYALLATGRTRVKAYEDMAKRHPDAPEVFERFARVLDEVGAKTRAREMSVRAKALRARSS